MGFTGVISPLSGFLAAFLEGNVKLKLRKVAVQEEMFFHGMSGVPYVCFVASVVAMFLFEQWRRGQHLENVHHRNPTN